MAKYVAYATNGTDELSVGWCSFSVNTSTNPPTVFDIDWYTSYASVKFDNLISPTFDVGKVNVVVNLKSVINQSYSAVSNKRIGIYIDNCGWVDHKITDISNGKKTFSITDKKVINGIISGKRMRVYMEADITGTPNPSDFGGTPGKSQALVSRDENTYIEFLSTYDLSAITPNNLSFVSGDSMQFSWDFSTTLENVEQASYELFISKDGGTFGKIAENQNSNSNTHTYNTSNLQQGNYKWKVKITTTNGQSLESNQLDFKILGKPTITNLTTIGDFYEKPISVNWRSEYQTGYEWEAYYNNTRITGGTGTTSKGFNIPDNTFVGTLPASIRVRVKNEIEGQTLWSNWAEKSITLKEITPTLDNLALSGSNIDLALVFSWVSTDQQNYEVKIVKDDVVKNYNGTTSQQVEIPASSLQVGLYKFRVRVAYKDRWTDWKEITATLIETLPSIGAFEPDGVIVERDNPIRVWWTSSNQSKWKLVIDESLTYTGTITNEYILPAATLQTGTHSMVLTVTYVTGAGVEKHSTKKAEFIVQGKPPIPTITNTGTFNSNRPLITWDTQEQQGYLLEVLNGESIVYSTDWKNGLVTSHKVLDYLDNDTYTVRIKIINQFGLESDYGSKTITVYGTEATNINLLVRNEGSYTKLVWDNTGDKFRTFYVIRNGNVIAKVDGTEYIDYTCNHENIYVVRGINSSDVFKDSNSVIVNVSIRGGLLATIDNLSDMINVGISRNSNEFGGNIDISHSLIHLTGRELPVGVFGEHRSGVYNLRFSTKDNLFIFLEMCYRRKVFCYRDKRQTLYLTIPNPQYDFDKFGMQYTIQANEVGYDEVIAYD